MGKKNAGADEAKQARADEQARQDRIRQGTTRINSIFDGGTTGTGQIGAGTAYDPTKTYYNADGSAWTPKSTPAFDPANPFGGLQQFGQSVFGGGGGDHGGSRAGGGVDSTGPGAHNGGGAGQFWNAVGNSVKGAMTPAQQFAQAQKDGLFSSKTTTPGFDDNFFNGRKQAYLDYADPQLESQYGDANKQLTFSLARGGLLDSSVRGQQQGVLQKLYDTQKQGVADKALAYETGARNSVEDARSNLISTLNATGDAEGAAKSALARSSALTQPDAYSPLGQLFTDFTSGLGIQAAQERAAYASGGAYKSPYNTGLFSPGRVSVS